MKTQTVKTIKIVADEGYIFCNLDKSQVYGDTLYLGKNDSAENYIEITIEEGEEIKAELEKLID
ncbi:hypothetical protein [Dysgonomonas sp. 520]|uniref:hypothetical protein n=1 Tax=Dysgonomonas sp. 520 TaxID=2302931 RepID=UPI0013D0116C|nr:hypothetical protein [Dysgonomonas sp. 520]NDW09829.1 hypothetical protein [Dysgonomonas sp. 520]